MSKRKYEVTFTMDKHGVTELALTLDNLMHCLEARGKMDRGMTMRKWDHRLDELLKFANTPRARGAIRAGRD